MKGTCERQRERERRGAIFIDARGPKAESGEKFGVPLSEDGDAGSTGSPDGPSCPSAHWWRDPECIESRIFADFRRASFAHGLPRVLPGARHRRSVYCVAAWTAGGLQPPCGPVRKKLVRSARRRGTRVPSRTRSVPCGPLRAVLERTLHLRARRARHMVLAASWPDQLRPRSRSSSSHRSRWTDQ